MKIREATPDDYEGCLAIFDAWWSERPLPYCTREQMLQLHVEQFLALVYGTKPGLCLVAERDGAVGGFALWMGDGVALQGAGVYVHPAARRQGVGERLLELATRLAAERGFARVLMTPMVDSAGSSLWLDRLGFRPLQVVMVKEL